MRKINKIILHCAATPEGKHFTVEDIDSWHKKRGFKCIGYHYVIYLDGTIAQGRTEDQIGAHCTGENKDSIGICYIGGCDKNGKPKDTRTQAQKESMVILIKDILNRYNLKDSDIHFHYEYANKACPSFTKEEFFEDYNDIIGSICYEDKE